MSEFDKAEEKSWREYVKRVDGNLAGPSSLFGNGFSAGRDYEKKRAEGLVKVMDRMLAALEPPHSPDCPWNAEWIKRIGTSLKKYRDDV